MSFKTVMSVLTDTDFAETTLKQASRFARSNNAHLDVLCLGVDSSQSGYYFSGASAVVVENSLAQVRSTAHDIEKVANSYLAQAECRWGVETGVCQLTEVSRHVSARARFSDLTVLPKPYGDNRGIEMETTIEAALFNAGSPVLVVPDEGNVITKPKAITIAWNESQEALLAAKSALPLLAEADLVRVLVIDPPTHGPNRSDPGGLLSTFLARHGVRVEIDVLSKSMPRVSDVILRHARDTEAEMIVMGAYGHSRFRESILGGATRHMLEQAEIPVFMAH